ncbi:FAD-dependent oxidoreductase [Bordetella sp. BOR01]|uniref:FAD-dependent oxidoreductase n=1 Tax=Bordetella sp. BOR01 TaxID=2854779 RepID=UPI001C48E42A|nr:FAD-dependent oxidoreductase [Bordetella sp. BOR01]MBV7483852.1 FAD-dependent oxidoreductase [Bordetella sp. BOR01]
MPVLQRPARIPELMLPPRKAGLAAETDVLVVGGGPAGIGAAVGAARAGADVILVERYGFLGGNATAALVMPLMSFHTQRPTFEKLGVTNLLPDDHGPGHPVIAGVLKELLERLVGSGGAVAPSLDTGYVVPFDPEIFKSAALELLDQAGVRMLFHSFASGIFGEGDVQGVVFETKSGPLVIKAKAVVDCTGDGDVAALAGAGYEMGREADGLVQPMTLMFRMADFNPAAFQEYVRQNPGQWRGVHGLWDLVRQASANGDLNLAREDILFFGTPHAHEVSVNSTRVTRVLGTDVWDWTLAEWESRHQLNQLMRFLRKYVPGFQDSYAVQSGVHVGVRETRRIVGEYQLTAQDLLGARKFPDAIARGSYPVDIHNPAGKGTILKRIPADDAYDIPLRALIPQRIDKVIVAGRCISGTHEAHSSYRVMPIAMATGQAAGICAAAAARRNIVPRDVAAQEVREELMRQGASLGQP